MEESVYLTTAYLAPVEYYAKLYAYSQVFIEQHDHYLKQTYRNRCTIAAADGMLTLSIPTEKYDTLKCETKEIRISDHGNWRHLHWNAIESAYSNSPYFEYYQDDFAPFYEKKYPFLIDFNEALNSLICKLIDLQPHIERTHEYKMQCSDLEHDFRNLIHPKKDYAKDDPYFHVVPYYQVFEHRHGFLPNLSIIDLLFNMGPESLLVLKSGNK